MPSITQSLSNFVKWSSFGHASLNNLHRVILMEFPTIHTNFWDGVLAVPLIVILTQAFKILPIPKKYIPTVAGVIGFSISLFASHRGNLVAGLFMGGFYSSAAIGTYASLKTTWLAFKRKRLKKKRIAQKALAKR